MTPKPIEWTGTADSISSSLDPIDAFKAASDSISSGFGGLSKTAFNIADQALARARNRALMSENTDEFDQNMAYVLGATGGASNEALSNLARNVALDRATVDAADLLRAKRAVDEKQNAVNAAYANGDVAALRSSNTLLANARDAKGRVIRSDAFDLKSIDPLLTASMNRAQMAEALTEQRFRNADLFSQRRIQDVIGYYETDPQMQSTIAGPHLLTPEGQAKAAAYIEGQLASVPENELSYREKAVIREAVIKYFIAKAQAGQHPVSVSEELYSILKTPIYDRKTLETTGSNEHIADNVQILDPNRRW